MPLNLVCMWERVDLASVCVHVCVWEGERVHHGPWVCVWEKEGLLWTLTVREREREGLLWTLGVCVCEREKVYHVWWCGVGVTRFKWTTSQRFFHQGPLSPSAFQDYPPSHVLSGSSPPVHHHPVSLDRPIPHLHCQHKARLIKIKFFSSLLLPPELILYKIWWFTRKLVTLC